MLTRRRLEFLRALKKIQQEEGKPVHYTLVAREMRVSKWTAYDLLRELEEEGYLEAVFEELREEKTRGRKQLLYRLTPKGEEVLRLPGGEEWQALRSRLLSKLQEKGRATRELIAELLSELSQETSRLARSAYKLAVLLASLEEMGFKRGKKLLVQYLARLSSPEQGLNLFTGVVLANFLRDRGGSLPVRECLRRWLEVIPNLTSEELRCLLEFLREGLSRGRNFSPDTKSF
ncbi:putative transcriptional regulator [Ammonifex degensii KC4]|uniref:Transcriptional regulator n=1 Tax=Ammonifex degensii (strain DSM 10501 / KC4) TaxID=429009 RepID=C9R8L2_AMMDK|nr:helix-turn-helix transcriptional regulator [Ammonifex degensii]ACX52641.1 putative transcriptional regulator [Ammonifex degensii KC4]